MTQNQIRIRYLVHKLRYKHKENQNIQDALTRILWYSIPVVYPNWEIEDKLIEQAIDKRKKQKRRTRRYLEGMTTCYSQLHFVSLTFRDDVLDSTTAQTRHRYVSRYLDSISRDYFANIDYGEKNEREHFHAVVALKNTPTSDFPYGWSNIKPVGRYKRKNGDIKAISTYINKLSNHANKVTAGRTFHKRGMKEVDLEMELPF